MLIKLTPPHLLLDTDLVPMDIASKAPGGYHVLGLRFQVKTSLFLRVKYKVYYNVVMWEDINYKI